MIETVLIINTTMILVNTTVLLISSSQIMKEMKHNANRF